MKHSIPLVLLTLATGCDRLGICDNPPERELEEGSTEVQTLVEGNNAFAWDLYSTVRVPDENLFFSPLSISAAFGMVYAGAAGDTATAMEEVLAIGLDDDTFHPLFGTLLGDLESERRCSPVELSIANKVFAQEDFPFHEEYLDLVADAYDAPVETLDFSDSQGATDHVNHWVSDETRDNIPQILDSLDPYTVLVLANAIYMKADWAEPFEEERTTSDPVTLVSGEEVDVDTMHGTIEARWGLIEGGQIVEIPYEGDELAMVIVLPDEDVGLEGLEDGLTAEGASDAIDTLGGAEVNLSMPKFELRTRLDLLPPLSELGLGELFSPESADLSAMSDEELYVSAAVHEAWVEVDEEGTEAAAATVVGVSTTSASPQPVEVVVDHPFLVLIQDTVTGSTLFMGRVVDPRG